MINTSYYLYAGVLLFAASIASMRALHNEVKVIRKHSGDVIDSLFESIKSECSKEDKMDKHNLHTHINDVCSEKRKQIHLIEDVRNCTLCLFFSAFLLVIIGLLPQATPFVNGLIPFSDEFINSIIGAGSAIVGMLFLIAILFSARIVHEISKLDKNVG